MTRLAVAVQTEAARRSGDNEVRLRVWFVDVSTPFFSAEIAVKPPRARNRYEDGKGHSADSAIEALADKLGVAL